MFLGTTPIEEYEREILDAVEQSDVVIIEAETGAGKSTKVPQILSADGYKISTTEPRALAAMSLSQWVSHEQEELHRAIDAIVGEERPRIDGLVAYRTAFEGNDKPYTRMLFCTDGLQLVRSLRGNTRQDILILDEVHEWNVNVEALVAWTREQVRQKTGLKVVLMSATMDAGRLAEYYGSGARVIRVPGRLFPVTEEQIPVKQRIAKVRELVKAGHNVLVFEPGKREISETIRELSDLNAKVLPLHGELKPDEQELCFRNYDVPIVVVSTNVAQTSVTIPGIDAVVDSGLEKRLKMINGIEKLCTEDISQADCKQRKGRAGRCKPGAYYLASATPIEARPAERTPEIMVTRLDSLVLHFATFGQDVADLEFFHQPAPEKITEAKQKLFALGAMTRDGEITPTGRLMDKLPMNTEHSRMVVEASRLDAMEDVLSLVAIAEAGGIRHENRMWKALTRETESDWIVELELWRKAKQIRPEDMENSGYQRAPYFRALQLRKKYRDRVEALRQSGDLPFRLRTFFNRENTLRACMAGLVDRLHVQQGENTYMSLGGTERKVRMESVARGQHHRWVVGVPVDIGHATIVKSYLDCITAVDPEVLMELAPHLVERDGDAVIFNGMEITL